MVHTNFFFGESLTVVNLNFLVNILLAMNLCIAYNCQVSCLLVNLLTPVHPSMHVNWIWSKTDLDKLLCSELTGWFIQVKLTKISYTETLFKFQFIQVKLTKISYIRTLFKFQFIQVKLTKISYTETLFKFQFIQDSGLFTVRFRRVSLYIFSKD